MITGSKQFIIDMHSHLIPCVDDGSRSIEESLKAMKTAEEQGISEIILTSHNVDKARIEEYTDLSVLKSRYEDIRKAAVDNGINIRLHLGQECLYHSNLVKMLDDGSALTMAGSRYVLVEFLQDISYRELLENLTRIRDGGYIPVLAHYERYDCLTKKGAVRGLKDEMFLIQMNFDTVQREYGLLKRNPFQKDLLNGYVDFMGSDCHGVEYRKYFIVPSVKWMKEKLPEAYFRKLLIDNPRKILEKTY